ncbi:MAG: hypothetical protein IKF68_01915 [Erysipelotrichaceae bacterium]|nr:hypothetical protein [Erysipelotrichaceae bacterium]
MKNTIGKDLVRNIVSIIFIIVCIILIINRTRSDVAGGIDIEDLESLGTSLGIISLLPTILAVFLAFVFKNVILSLLAGLLLGGLIYAGILGGSLLDFFTLSCQELVNTVSDYENASILVLCLAIGGMIEVIRRSGGFSDLAGRMTNHIDTPKKANLFTQLLGVLVFFDDYANALIVGPVMQPICDRLKVSREKLAYIVDSTAAPVTGIALISSWVAVEVGVIEQGLANAGSTLSGYGLFIESIPYCFYCIFCLLFILISSLTGREFGPMYRTECEARKGQIDREYTASYEEEENRPKQASFITAVLPLVILFIYAFSRFIIVGKANALAEGIITGNEPFSIHYLSTIFGQADTIYIVFEATVLGTVVAIVLGMIEKVFSLREAIAHFAKGCSDLFETDLILALAWTMSSFVSKIGAVHFTVNFITSNVSAYLVPILIFTVCCVISFAVGSYGCMFIALPMAIPIALTMMDAYPSLSSSFLPLVIACGLSGSIFGDHCSPITDCTILSSKGSGCSNFDHVRTQLPYAIVTAFVSIAAGIIPTTFGLPVLFSFAIAAAVFCLILRFFGRVPA